METRQSKKNIIVAGAGFGGITAVLALTKTLESFEDAYQIVLINPRSHHLYTPALYEIAAMPKENMSEKALHASIMIPIADIIAGTNIIFIADEVANIRVQEKKVLLKGGSELAFEFLILALGSETNYFGIPGLAEESLPLKTFDDAVRLRNSIEDQVQRKNSLEIVVGGGGASGVELVAEFVNFVCELHTKAHMKKCDVRFTLLEAAAEILSGFDPWMVKRARRRLQSLGVVVRTNVKITSATPREIMLEGGEKKPFDVFIWTGGVKGPSVLTKIGLPLSPKGTLMVNQYLEVENSQERIFAIGDNAWFINPKTGRPLLWNVPIAESEARFIARHLKRTLSGKTKIPYVPRDRYPYVLTVGEKYAIADMLWVGITGFWGWILKQIVELRYFLFILPFTKAIKTWLHSVHAYSSND